MITPKNGNIIIELLEEKDKSLLGAEGNRNSGIVISDGSEFVEKGAQVFFDERMLNEITIEGKKVFYVNEDNVIAVH